MLIAASKDAAFKSGIFNSAISCNFALESVATFVLFGVAEPDLMLEAFLINTGADWAWNFCTRVKPDLYCDGKTQNVCNGGDLQQNFASDPPGSL